MVGEILPGGPSRVWKLAVWAVVAGDVLQYSSKCHHWKSQLSSSCRRLFRDTSDSHRASKLSSQPEILEQSLCQSIDDDTEDDDDSDDHEMISVVKLTPSAVTDIIDLRAVSWAAVACRCRGPGQSRAADWTDSGRKPSGPELELVGKFKCRQVATTCRAGAGASRGQISSDNLSTESNWLPLYPVNFWSQLLQTAQT